MGAGILNFTTFEQGTSFSKTLTINESGGGAKDLTNVSFAGHIRPREHSSDKITDLTFTITNAATGTVTMSLTPAQTSKITDGAVYDVEMTEGSTVTRIMQGTFTVDAEVTR